MKNKLIKLIPYALVLAVDFYLLPFLIRDTGIAMLMMLCVIPLIAFMCSVLLFFPTIFIFYNESALIYVVIYGIVTFVGNVIGRIFYKKR